VLAVIMAIDRRVCPNKVISMPKSEVRLCSTKHLPMLTNLGNVWVCFEVGEEIGGCKEFNHRGGISEVIRHSIVE